MIEVNEVEISLGKKKTLQTTSFTIHQGLWALIGRNGSGKSSFLNAILQLKAITAGSIKVDSKKVNEWSASELSKLVSVVYTKPEVFGSFTAFDVVMLGRLPYTNAFGIGSKKDTEMAKDAINTLNIKYLTDKLFNILSDGEKQMVMIARALAQDTAIIILDEPTAFLDVVNRKDIILLLKKITTEQNKTILFSTHDVEQLPEVCDGLLWINHQKLRSSEKKSEFSETINQLFSK